MNEYIKYSERNKIKDTFLAKLVDHIERVIGWDIDTMNSSDKYTSINAGNRHIYLYEGKASLTIDGRMRFEMEQRVFETEYTNLLSHYKK